MSTRHNIILPCITITFSQLILVRSFLFFLVRSFREQLSSKLYIYLLLLFFRTTVLSVQSLESQLPGGDYYYTAFFFYSLTNSSAFENDKIMSL